MSNEELIKAIQKKYRKQGQEKIDKFIEALDEDVHDAASDLASSINNSSPTDQLEFLIAQFGVYWVKENYLDQDFSDGTVF